MVVASNVDKLSNLPPPLPVVDNRGPSSIISKVTHRSHTRDPEYCLLSEKRNPIQKKP
jgi:hypothetical protein